jgi:hypothetical protein
MKCITLSDPRGLYLTNDFIVTHNSNDYGLFTVLHWITDPLHTVCLVGSTTLGDLKSRTWESIVRYHGYLKNNALGLEVPGAFSKTGYSFLNASDVDIPESLGSKASIQGRALNEGGRLQGAHLPYVMILIDEIAAVTNHEAIRYALANLRTGAKDFRFYGLGNPEGWEDPSSDYCIPANGIEAVNVDTGVWQSAFGARVRHHDGLKSPCVLDPSLATKYPYLMNIAQVEETVKEAHGNYDAPVVWQMVRGFPRPAATSHETVLDMAIATRQCCTHQLDDPLNQAYRRSTFAGCDPAWSATGDDALLQKVDVMVHMGRPILCFRQPQRLVISSSSANTKTALEQLSHQVYDGLVKDRTLRPSNIFYDGSGNQSLCGAVTMRCGEAGVDVNSSVRASDRIFRDGSPNESREMFKDRGAEAWAVLAEFCRAGMVRGLSAEAQQQLCSRRWAVAKNKVQFPRRLESKEDWCKRSVKGSVKSPNDCDAAALAALAVKEAGSLLPWQQAVPYVPLEAALPHLQQTTIDTGGARGDSDYSVEFCDGSTGGSVVY